MRLTFIAWLLGLGAIASITLSTRSTCAAEKVSPPMAAEAVEDEPDATASEGAADESPADEEPAPEAGADEPSPLPDAEEAASTAQPLTGDDAEPDTESLAPPPPSGSLIDRIKKASAPVDRPKPAAFQSILVGESTLEDLTKAWGAPLEATRQKELLRHTYRLDAIGRIEVQIYRDVVQSITAHYDQHPRWAQLAGELGMDKLEPVDIEDEFGERLGMALPENGVMIGLESGSRERRVAQVIYEPVDAQAFVLRAEHRLRNDYTGCLRDLDLALVVDPQCAQAFWLRARVLRMTGQIDAACKAAAAALALEPKNPQFQLTHSQTLADSGQYAKAIEETKQALGLCAAQPALRASATNQLGEQMTAGPEAAYKAALPLHMQAIKLAEPLVEDRHTAVRHLAQETLVAAHLAAARNIAWGDWKMKKKMVPAWLNRADELAQGMAGEDGAPADIGFRVCREALAACVGMEGDLDPTPWIEKALAQSTSALEATKDPLRHRQLDWELGAALYDAVQVYHTAGDVAQATKYGTLAAEHLEAGAEDRQLQPVETFLLGRLYYRMGALLAINADDSEKAVIWYERAIPLLERPLPATATRDQGRHGESFVSMAVSYWAVGSHEEALRLTRAGLKLMEQAVKDGTLDGEALRIPYTNLATMHRFLGDDEQAEAFSNMAAKASGSRQK